ncbi:MAG TPA: DUF3237 domain-containing protein [Steroidobacteraceae bacterium]|jgi:hypothetical protein|nr:DUF3237 domain-containing protein [Steroidobacteraceae bacterium]
MTSRRTFLSGATTVGAVALSGLQLSEAASGDAAAPGSNDEALPAQWFEGPDPSIPKLGLRWAFSARVFFADRVMINTMDSPAGRGYTSVGGGDIWGPRLQGRVLPHSGADYYKTTFNTYYMLQAADGALIFIHNRGTMRRFASHYEPGKPLLPPPAPPASQDGVWTRFRATSYFTAPIGPHDWMNRTVFVANSQRQSNPDHTVFNYYEVL